MCGIAGYFNLSGKPASPRVLRDMIEIQRHRGPNDQGMLLFSLAKGTSFELNLQDNSASHEYEGALGFNRLSILDLSERGHQPMRNKDGTIFIAFNGEIYNAFSYVTELQQAGFKFRSRTDTEVILYLYERHGLEGMLARLNGMFTIVIVDLNRQEICIARDHLGIKPFYWALRNDAFLFASEVKSFLVHPDFSCELETAHLDEYLAFRYCAGERHLLKGVQQLRPGHCLRLKWGGKPTVSRYWQIPDCAEPARISFEEALSRLDALLRASVKSQLLSDVKVGCQLSGGIDSSLVSVFARSHLGADMDTFSIVFRDAAYSEERWVSQAANVVKADNHRFMLTAEDFFKDYETASWHLDQPLNHPNSLGIYLLAAKARKLVTVLLSGEGADELFGGYPRFYCAAIRPEVRPWLPVLRRLPKVGPKFLRAFGADHSDPAMAFIASTQFQQWTNLLAVRPEANLERALEQRRAIFAEGNSSHLGNCLKYEMQTYMVDLLVRQDKMTMAHSMENRVPFLDLDLVAFVRSLPTEYLVSRRFIGRGLPSAATKVILKDLAGRTFDDSFVYRPKGGFKLPLLEFFRGRQFQRFMQEEIIPGMRRRGLLNVGTIENWWQNLERLSPDMHEVLWISISFELWARRFLQLSKHHG